MTRPSGPKDVLAAPPAEAAGGAGRLLESPAVQFVAKYQAALVVLAWLARFVWSAHLGNDPDIPRYFDVSGAWLQGGIPYLQYELEYPPGALVFFALPRLFTDDVQVYHILFILTLLLVDGIILSILRRLPMHLSQPDAHGEAGRRYDATVCMLAYIALVGVCSALPFERYDLLCALLFLAWIDQTLRCKRFWAADVLLALGIWIKLVAAMLIPVYLVYLYAAASKEPFQHRRASAWRHLGRWIWRDGLRHLASITVYTGALFGWFYMRIFEASSDADGSTWDRAAAAARHLGSMFTYHINRGLQLESSYASFLLLLHNAFGMPLAVADAFGCRQMVNDAAPLLAVVAPVITLLALAGISGWFGWRLLVAHRPGEREALLIRSGLALLLAFMIFNKVFSLQYLLWVAPLAPLVSLHDRGTTRSWLLGFGVAFLLTAVMMGHYDQIYLMRPFGTALLLARNGVLAALLWSLVGIRAPAWGTRALLRAQRLVQAPGWMRAAGTLSALWVFIMNLEEIGSSDTWTQLRFGADIIASGSIPFKEVYSATVYGVDFVCHEWLSGVVFAWLVAVFGPGSLSVLVASGGLACIALLYVSQPPEQRHSLYCIPLLLLIAAMIAHRVEARPHLFTMVAQAAIVLALERWRRGGGWRPLAWLLPMQLVWVNLHGGALFGPALFCVLCGVVGALAFVPGLQRGGEPRLFQRRDALQLGGMAVALSAACLLNPYGARLLTWALGVVGDTHIKELIFEWRPTFQLESMTNLWFWCYLVVLAMLWGGLYIRRHTLPLMDLALATLVTVMSLRSTRFVTDLAIFAFPIVARSLTAVAQTSLRSALRRQRPWLELGLATLLVTHALTTYADTGARRAPLVGWGFGGDIPSEEVGVIKKLHIKGIIFTEYNDGDIIIHDLVPDVRPVIDSRIDLYPIAVQDEYFTAYHNLEAFRRYLVDHHVNLVCLPESANPDILAHLAADPSWRLLTQTNGRVLYWNKSVAPYDVTTASTGS